MLLGAHMSTVGGVHTAFERGTRIGCTTMQVFVKNNNQWAGKPQTQEDINLYKSEEAKAAIAPVVAHAAYLINLCSTNAGVLKKSRTAFEDELRRCEGFGIKALIFHPGAHLGAGEEEGIKRIAESLNLVHERTRGFRPLSTLECTAGQGSAIGYRFEHLRGIIDLVDEKDRMAVCLDTCHLFAAGYNIGTEDGWNDTIKQFDEIVGLDRLVAIHTNDSKKALGSRVDRHEHIGRGMIGLKGFRMLMNDDRLADIPKILETEKSDDMHEDEENMNVLKSLRHLPDSKGV
ncbi:MAG: deoxyribonuclease IV [Bacteroidetes bacterium]|nr:deoxyribonuclease IV [Bacteroidota bacterium]MCW5894560.1 deoxyribonuclease IV [Bacteroidota bacterium]